jgi:uncharacterized protein
VRLAVLIAVALGAGLAIAAPAAEPAPTAAPALARGEVLLRVDAQGRYASAPDVMSLTAETVTTGRTARDGVSANNRLSDKLLAAVRALGVDARDVRTSTLSVEPQMDGDRADREGREPRITGYVATNSLELRLRDLSRAGEAVDALFAAGANTVEGPRFSLSDPRPAQREARRAAVAAAREQAETYAEALGVRLERVIQLAERGEVEAYANSGIIRAVGPSTSIVSGELETRVTPAH